MTIPVASLHRTYAIKLWRSVLSLRSLNSLALPGWHSPHSSSLLGVMWCPICFLSLSVWIQFLNTNLFLYYTRLDYNINHNCIVVPADCTSTSVTRLIFAVLKNVLQSRFSKLAKSYFRIVTLQILFLR